MIIDMIKAFTWVTMGFIIGFISGIAGLATVFNVMPDWLRVLSIVVIVTGILTLFAYFRPDKIERIKK